MANTEPLLPTEKPGRRPKEINGRKRHILVDRTGLMLRVIVHAADVKDPAAAPRVLEAAKEVSDRLTSIWADMR